MEYTTTFADSPFPAVFGSDGAFLNPFGEWGFEPSAAPQCSTGSSSCGSSQGTGNEAKACPHRQECYQTLGDWYLRRGQYQRSDVTVHDRLDIARRFLEPDRPWGEVASLEQEYSLSRTAIRDIANRVAVLFEPRFRVSSKFFPVGRSFLHQLSKTRYVLGTKKRGCAIA